MGLGVVLVAVTLAQNPDLVRAQAAFEGLKYADAARALEAAWAAPGNDRETVLEVLKLQAIVAAATGQVDRARTLFRTLLYLAPEFVLPEGDLGPKVMTLFYEAKGRVAVNGVLQLVARPPVRDGDKVREVGVQVTDPQALGQSFRFHHRAPGFEWTVTPAPLVEGVAVLAVDLPTVEWWAELLGENDRGLARLGSADQPISTAKDAPARVPAPAAAVSARPTSPLKPVGIVVAGLGVVAGIAGGVFGLSANGQKALIENASRDGSGRVTGITRQTALQLNEQQKTSATLANTLFVASGALVAAGVVLYVLAPDASVSAGAGGVSVGGTW